MRSFIIICMKNTSADTSYEYLAGIWKSTYTYHNSEQNKESTSSHYVQLHPHGDQLVIESLKDHNESYLILRLWLDGEVATGSWQEVTSASGDFKGTVYHGAIQLIIESDHKHLTGKWVGFGRQMNVKSGAWQFEYVGREESAIKK